MTGPVMLGYVHGGTVRAEFMASVLAAVSGPDASGLIGGVTDMSAGPLVSLARNMLMTRFLESALDWLWCCDTDIMFTPALPGRLLAAADPDDRPVMSGLYHLSLGAEPVPAMFTAGGNAGRLTFTPVRDYEPGAVIRVDGVGAGCLLIHRAALETMRDTHDGQPLWWREVIHDTQYVGEDLSFCIRAAAAGIPVHVDTGAQAGHLKTVILGQAS